MNAVREMAISAVDDLLGSHFDRRELIFEQPAGTPAPVPALSD